MKTLVLSVVFAVTSIVNAVNNNSLEGFAYNTRMDGDRVETKNVYKVKEDKYLQNHLQYNYAYDAEGRVSSKEVSKWSKRRIRSMEQKRQCLHRCKNQSRLPNQWNGRKLPKLRMEQKRK